ncbi:internal scaffolding protein [Microviridae sp.]|nr:internal scaffolding protein [Microviridae sp.]
MKHLNINSPSRKVRIKCPQGVTKQHHKAECDINQIMAKFQKTGLINHINENEAKYGDVSGDDFYDSCLIIANANSMFEELPSTVRKNFDNDPGKFLKFVENPDNEGKLIEYGLANPRLENNLSPLSENLPNTTNIEPATAETEQKNNSE